MRVLPSRFSSFRMIPCWIMVLAVCAMHAVTAQAQFFPGFGGFGFVGGVRIDADGVLRNMTVSEQQEQLELIRRKVVAPNGPLTEATSLRCVSLRKIQEAILESAKTQKPLSAELMYMAGLTRIEYVFVYPDRQDIVLAGPAEPWTVGPYGTMVGTKSGRPIVYLEDLLTAFRYVSNARQGGVSISIEPTEQGVVQLQQAHQRLRLAENQTAQFNPNQIVPVLADAFGPQKVVLQGIPQNSHMARVLLAADYRMKLYGMNLAEAPVKGLPSYLEMIRNRTNVSSQIQSRWWMACDYEAVSHSADRLAWRISGPGIKTLTEQEIYDASGAVQQTGKVDATAKKWADLFTKKLDELAIKDTAFGDLRNVMDLCVIAAIIEAQNLESVAACDLSGILGDKSQVETPQLDFPQSLSPQISLVQSVQGLVVSASGGVMIESWQAATHTQEDDRVAQKHRQAAEWKTDSWFQ
jgi:hypothetical protein